MRVQVIQLTILLSPLSALIQTVYNNFTQALVSDTSSI